LFLACLFAMALSFLPLRFAVDEARKASYAARQVRRVLTDSFFRTIGVSDENFPTSDEREALWELAQHATANASVRENLLNLWFRTPDAFQRGNLRSGQGFRAATGLNLEYQRLVMSNATNLVRSVALALENQREANRHRLLSLGNALAALANKIEPQAAVEIAK